MISELKKPKEEVHLKTKGEDYKFPKLLYSKSQNAKQSSSGAKQSFQPSNTWSNLQHGKIRSAPWTHLPNQNFNNKYKLDKSSLSDSEVIIKKSNPQNLIKTDAGTKILYQWNKVHTEPTKREEGFTSSKFFIGSQYKSNLDRINKYKLVKSSNTLTKPASYNQSTISKPVTKHDFVKSSSSKQPSFVNKYKFVKNSDNSCSSKVTAGAQTNYTNFKSTRLKPKHPQSYTTQLHNKEKLSGESILSKYKFVRKDVPIKTSIKTFHQNKWTPGNSFIRKRYKIVQRRRSSTDLRKAVRKSTRRSGTKDMLSTMSTDNNSFLSRRLLYICKKEDQKVFKTLHPKYIKENKLTGSPTKTLILSRHGSEFTVSGNFKSLRKVNLKTTRAKPVVPVLSRFSTTASKYQFTSHHSKYRLQRQLSLNTQMNAKRLVAKKLVKKNLLRVYKKKSTESKYCLFYCRFGKCKRGVSCKFLHDPEKVAVCTRFLRGTCKDEKCVFSHKIDPTKMPVCSYFLNGECNRTSCPYRHVKVSETAEICQDFLKGYCAKGDKCSLKHVLVCDQFANTGICSKGSSCKLRHQNNRKKFKRRRTLSKSGTRKPNAFKKQKTLRNIDTDVLSIPISPMKDKSNILPKFISKKIIGESSKSFGIRNLFETEASTSNSDRFGQAIRIDDIPSDPIDAVAQHIDEIGLVPDPLSTPDGYIPLTCSSGSESSDSDNKNKKESNQRCDRRFSFKEQDFISL